MEVKEAPWEAALDLASPWKKTTNLVDAGVAADVAYRFLGKNPSVTLKTINPIAGEYFQYHPDSWKELKDWMPDVQGYLYHTADIKKFGKVRLIDSPPEVRPSLLEAIYHGEKASDFFQSGLKIVREITAPSSDVLAGEVDVGELWEDAKGQFVLGREEMEKYNLANDKVLAFSSTPPPPPPTTFVSSDRGSVRLRLDLSL